MKRLPVTLACLGVLLTTVIGCGSSSPPPFTVSCTLHRLPSGAVRAAVTVKNNTSNPGGAIIYGPALRWVTHEYPLLATRFVVDTANGQRASYIGFAVPSIKGNGSRYLLLRFRPPPQPAALLVTNAVRLRKANLRNPDCLIKRA